MWTDDPVHDEMIHTLEQEKAYEAWCESRNLRCAECQELIGDEEYIDFSGSGDEGYVFHVDCIEEWFDKPKEGNLCELLREIVLEDYRRDK